MATSIVFFPSRSIIPLHEGQRHHDDTEGIAMRYGRFIPPVIMTSRRLKAPANLRILGDAAISVPN